MTGTAKEAWDSIQNEWGKSTDMWHSHAQEALNWTVYIEGTEIQDHIKLLQIQKVMVNNLSTSICWAGIPLAVCNWLVWRIAAMPVLL